jgi:hypothetical protein
MKLFGRTHPKGRRVVKSRKRDRWKKNTKCGEVWGSLIVVIMKAYEGRLIHP